MVWETDYDIYGDLRSLKGDRSFIPFRQLGQYEDVETSLYYNRFRYYNPESGLYISRDPLEIDGNNPNMYAYVFNSNFEIDLFGLTVWNYGNMPKIDGYQNHHVIPRSMADHPAIKAADFDVDKPSNLIYLPKEEGTHPTRSRHKGWNKGHSDYNKDMKRQLDLLDQKGMAQGWDQAKYKAEIEKLRGKTRKGLREGKIKCH